MNCFWCETKLTEIPATKHISTHFKCPQCGGTWWPGKVEGLSEAEVAWNDEQAYKRSISKPGGGNSSGRKRKKPQKKAYNPAYTEA